MDADWLCAGCMYVTQRFVSNLDEYWTAFVSNLKGKYLFVLRGIDFSVFRVLDLIRYHESGHGYMPCICCHEWCHGHTMYVTCLWCLLIIINPDMGIQRMYVYPCTSRKEKPTWSGDTYEILHRNWSVCLINDIVFKSALSHVTMSFLLKQLF